jgi:hypothetical protein
MHGSCFATYEPRDPSRTVLSNVVADHLETFLAALDADPDAKGLPASVQGEFYAYLQCGILAHGFLRLGCDMCQKELLPCRAPSPGQWVRRHSRPAPACGTAIGWQPSRAAQPCSLSHPVSLLAQPQPLRRVSRPAICVLPAVRPASRPARGWGGVRWPPQPRGDIPDGTVAQ